MRWVFALAFSSLALAHQRVLVVDRHLPKLKTNLDQRDGIVGKGIHGFLSAPFFDFVAKATLTTLQTSFPNLPIPDTDIDAPVPVLGDIHFMLRNAKVNSIRGNYETTSMTLSDDRISFDVEDLSIEMSGDWRWEKGVAHSHGKVEISAVKSHIRAVLSLTMSENGTAVVGVEDVFLNLGELDIRIYGSKLTWIYNLVKAIFGGAIKDVIESEVPATVKAILPDEFNKILQSLPTKLNILPGIDLDVSIDQVAIQQDGLSAFLKSTVFYDQLRRHIECPNHGMRISQGQRKDNPDWSKKMIQLHVSSEFLNCLMKALQHIHFFQANLTVPINNDRIPVTFSTLAAPSIEFNNDFITLRLDEGRVCVSIPEQSEVVIAVSTVISFKLSVSTDTSLKLSIVNSSITTQTIAGELQSSLFPAVLPSILTQFIETRFASSAQGISATGIKLPWPLNEISLTDVDVVVRKDELGVGLQFALLT